MRLKHLREHLNLLKKESNPAKFREILISLADTFVHWCTFGNEILPFVEGKIGEAQRMMASSDYSNVDSAVWSVNQWRDWVNIKKMGIWLESEVGVVRKNALELEHEVEITGSINRNSEKYKEVMAYLEDFEKKIETGDHLLEKLIEEFASFIRLSKYRIQMMKESEEGLKSSIRNMARPLG